MKKFFSGKRLYIILAALALIGLVVAVRSCVSKVEPDMVITYIGENYFGSDEFYANSSALEAVLDDINGDGNVKAELVTISFSANITAAQEQNNLTRLTMSMGGGESRVYIMDKAYCMRYADSEILADLSEFCGDNNALVNESGKVYGISVEGNPILGSLGLSDTRGVYVSLRAVSEMDGVNFKNIGQIDTQARKLIQYIIENNINNQNEV